MTISKTFYTCLFNQLTSDIMAILTIEVLKKLIENIPDDYNVEYDKETTIAPITDKVEIDVSGKRLIFK